MTNKELQAARKLLFLNVSEAAEHIGGVSVRSWQYWESGRSSVPVDVGEKIDSLLHERLVIIGVSEDLFKETNADEMVIDYYQTLKEYRTDHNKANLLEWRVRQSVAAHFIGERLAHLR